jgi:hypothetical protein
MASTPINWPLGLPYLLFGLILLIPLLIAAMVGWPAWFLASRRAAYVANRDEYRSAVGLPALPAGNPNQITLPISFQLWMFAWCLASISRHLHPALGLTLLSLVFASAVLVLAKRALVSWRILAQHADLEPRLRRIGRLEIAGYTAAALAALMFFHFHLVGYMHQTRQAAIHEILTSLTSRQGSTP